MSKRNIMEELILLRDRLDEVYGLDTADISNRLQDLIWAIGEEIGEF